jgi:hypothetical protein
MDECFDKFSYIFIYGVFSEFLDRFFGKFMDRFKNRLNYALL